MHDDPFLPFATALPSPGGGGARDELAAGPRRRTIDLARRVPDVVLALPSLGRLRVETGNAVARVEGAGDYTQLRFLGDVARVDRPGLAVRLRLGSVARAVAIVERSADADVTRRVVELRDARGVAVHRLTLDGDRHGDEFDTIVTVLAQAPGAALARGSATSLPAWHVADTGARAAVGAPDGDELRAAWFGLVGHREPAPPGSAPAASAMITRGRVLRAVGADWARPLPTAALRRVLARMAEDELPVSITVGNEACTQSCVGVMRVEDGDGATLVAAGHDGGVVVRGLDRGGCWAVREPRPRDAAWCLEAHDADGDLIATFQVARVGDVEVWNQRLAREPDAPDAGR